MTLTATLQSQLIYLLVLWTEKWTLWEVKYPSLHTQNFSLDTYLWLFPWNTIPKIKFLMKRYAHFMSLTDIKLSSLNIRTYTHTCLFLRSLTNTEHTSNGSFVLNHWFGSTLSILMILTICFMYVYYKHQNSVCCGSFHLVYSI